MKFKALLISLLFISTISQAQSLFKPIAKPAAVVNQHPSFAPRALAPTATTDSTLNAWRTTAAAVYGIPGNIAMGGVGLAYQHLKYDYTNTRWQAQWSVGAYAFAGGSVAPSTPADIMSVGILAGFYNDLIRVGPIYNMNGKFSLGVSVGINFNN